MLHGLALLHNCTRVRAVGQHNMHRRINVLFQNSLNNCLAAMGVLTAHLQQVPRVDRTPEAHPLRAGLFLEKAQVPFQL